MGHHEKSPILHNEEWVIFVMELQNAWQRMQRFRSGTILQASLEQARPRVHEFLPFRSPPTLTGLQAWAKLRHERPLYTRYSLHALGSNSKFSHDKATMGLGYHPRDLFPTIKDTVAGLKQPALHGGIVL